MKKAWYGTNSLILIGLNLGVTLLHIFKIFPYFYTFFYPMFMLLAALAALVGFFEKDKSKWQSLVAMILGGGLLIHWIIALVMRLSA